MCRLFFVALLVTMPLSAQDTKPETMPNAPINWETQFCEGDGCDAYLPILKKSVRFENTSGRRKWGAVLGGLSGAIIGEEVGGAPGAILFGAFGAAAGYDNIDRERWEANAKSYNQEWQRGGDTFYDPSHRLPLVAHWMLAGPAHASSAGKNK